MFLSAVSSPIGYFIAESDGDHLLRTYFSDQAQGGPSNHQTSSITGWFNSYLEDPFTPLPAFSLPESSEFSRQVLEHLLTLPPGTTTTYLEMALQLGDENYSRAVGAAVGANPLLVLIPCHRVLGSDGSLTGYAGGVHRKEWLLAHEGRFSGVQARLFDDR